MLTVGRSARDLLGTLAAWSKKKFPKVGYVNSLEGNPHRVSTVKTHLDRCSSCGARGSEFVALPFVASCSHDTGHTRRAKQQRCPWTTSHTYWAFSAKRHVKFFEEFLLTRDEESEQYL